MKRLLCLMLGCREGDPYDALPGCDRCGVSVFHRRFEHRGLIAPLRSLWRRCKPGRCAYCRRWFLAGQGIRSRRWCSQKCAQADVPF